MRRQVLDDIYVVLRYLDCFQRTFCRRNESTEGIAGHADMSFFLVQFWGPVLVPVLEHPMGDVPGEGQPPSNYPGSQPALGPTHSRLSTPGVSELYEGSDNYLDSTDVPQHGGPSPHQLQQQQQFSSPYQARQNLPSPLQTNLGAPQANMAQAQALGRGSNFNMAPLAAALPEGLTYGQGFVQQSSQRFPSGPSQAGLVYQLPQTAQFPGQMAMNQPNSPSFNMQYPQQSQGRYAQQPMPGQMQPSGSGTGQQFVPNPNYMGQQHQQQMAPYFYPPGQYASQNQMYQASQPQQYGMQYGNRPGLPGEGGPSSQQRGSEYRSGQGGQSGGAPTRPSVAGKFVLS
jgi:hypothetical protein